MSKLPLSPEPVEKEIPLREALEERYLSYALSTIMHRALPDVRDGLKPVHRRLLYAMRQLKLDPRSGFKKSARVVGDVIGRYHPHGDQSIYDALVRLAQDFTVRYPLVDGQGNFGNIDGDNAAAMRYTEARMTLVGEMLLEGIGEDTVDLLETYDGEDREPVVLPGAFPQLLANGASGIAVGMATSIPPHNASELCDAALYLIKHPGASTKKLLEKIMGPDFPTGGVIVDERQSLVQAYETGRGSFRVRARWTKEDLPRAGWQIVITEMPYQVQKSRLIEKIAGLLLDKKLPLLADVRDESAEDVRLVLEPRSRNVNPHHLMESLFRASELENRISLNLNVLSAEQVPGVMGLRDALNAWLAHRREVLLRRTRFRLGKAENRLEVLAGYLKTYLNLDEVIRIIREEEEPGPRLMEAFGLTGMQADAILNMRLRSLRRLEEMEIRKEHKTLSGERRQLRALLKSEEAQWKRLAEEVRAVREAFGPRTELGRRRTTFEEVPEMAIPSPEMIQEREPVTVVCSEKGWIRAIRGHEVSVDSLKYKEGDRGRFLFQAYTTDTLLLFATNGRFYTLPADKLPGGRGHGQPVRFFFDLEEGHAVVSFFRHDPERTLLVASASGHGFLVPEAETVALRRPGKAVLNVSGSVEAALCTPVEGDHVAVIGENRKLLVFPLAEVPEMKRGKGVRLQKYKEGGLRDIKVFVLKEGLTITDRSGRSRTFETLTDWQGTRAQAGRLPPKGFPRQGTFGQPF